MTENTTEKATEQVANLHKPAKPARPAPLFDLAIKAEKARHVARVSDLERMRSSSGLIQTMAFRTSVLAGAVVFAGAALDSAPLMVLAMALCVVGLVAFAAVMWQECKAFDLEDAALQQWPQLPALPIRDVRPASQSEERAMSRYRITHIDALRCKRVLHVLAPCRQCAVDAALRAYGDAWALSAIRAA